MKKIIVASTNPVKVTATKIAFEKMFPSESFVIEGVSVSSDVSAQPMTTEEAVRGARNRVTNAKTHSPEADFWVGIEGGVDELDGEMWEAAWTVIMSADGRIGKGRSVTFFLPPEITALIKEGKELGDAADIVFKKNNSKQINGTIGLLTDDVIDRTQFCADGVCVALVPFKNPELYT